MGERELLRWLCRVGWGASILGAGYAGVYELAREFALPYMITVVLAGLWFLEWVVGRKFRDKPPAKKDLRL